MEVIISVNSQRTLKTHNSLPTTKVRLKLLLVSGLHMQDLLAIRHRHSGDLQVVLVKLKLSLNLNVSHNQVATTVQVAQEAMVDRAMEAKLQEVHIQEGITNPNTHQLDNTVIIQDMEERLEDTIHMANDSLVVDQERLVKKILQQKKTQEQKKNQLGQ